MIATADDIKALGFNEDIFAISDEIPQGETVSPLTTFLERSIRRAERRIIRWVTRARYDEVAALAESDPVRADYAHAETLLAIADLLPAVYVQNVSEDERIEIEGFKLRLKKMSSEDQIFQRQQLVSHAENYLQDDISVAEYPGAAVV